MRGRNARIIMFLYYLKVAFSLVIIRKKDE